MKAAFIPPTPMLREFGMGQFHLLLSHLLPDRRYFDHYAWCRQNGAYLVLDNSAHESGEGDDAEMLLFNGAALNVQEIVVPDVLDDGPATVDRTLSALETWFEGTSKINSRVIHDLHPALMYVPQGKDFEEYSTCFDELVNLHSYISTRYDYRKDFVIGVSKDYEVWDGGIMRILDELIHPRIKKLASIHKIQVHMLGWGRDLWVLQKLGKQYPWLRSTDSAKPFVYGLKGINLFDALDHDPPKYPKRPRGYFNKRMNPQQEAVSRVNARVFRALAAGLPVSSMSSLPSV